MMKDALVLAAVWLMVLSLMAAQADGGPGDARLPFRDRFWIESQSASIDRGIAEGVICNPTLSDFSMSDIGMSSMIYHGGEFVTGYDLQTLANVTRTEEVVETVIEKIPRQAKNGTIEYDEIAHETLKKVDVTREEWVDGILGVARGACSRVRIVVRMKPTLGTRSVEYVPVLFGERFEEYGWFNTSWNYCKSVTVDNANMDSNLTNFPLYVYFNDSDIGGHGLADGFDIRFVNASCNSDGSELAYERESHVVWGDGKAEGRYWVRANATNSTATSTVISVYYGNLTDVADGEDSDGAWDSSFLSVWHMRDNSTAAGVPDSKTFRNATKMGGGPVQTTGKIGSAELFDGSNDYARSASFDFGSTFTYSLWVYTNTTHPADRDTLLYNSNPASDKGAVLRAYDVRNSGIRFSVYTTGWIELGTDEEVYDSKWHYVAARYNGSSLQVLMDGVQTDKTPQSGNVADAGTYFDMGQYGSNEFFNGTMDEVRVSSISRADAWLHFEFHNMNETDHELSFGAEETQAAGGDTTPPQWSGLSVNATNGTVYSYGAAYNFSALWTDDTLMGAVKLELAGVNHTATNVSSQYQYTAYGLGAGSYAYRWYGNDSTGNQNCTPVYTFLINKASTNMTTWHNGTSWNTTYAFLYTETVRFNGTVNASDIQSSVACYVNATASANPNTTTFSYAASLNWSCYFGGNANYTGCSAPNRTLLSLGAMAVSFLEPTPDDETLEWDGCWVNVSIARAASECLLDWNGTNETMQDMGNLEERVSKAVSDGNYTFRVWCNDTWGFAGATGTRWVYIKAPPFSPGNPGGPGGVHTKPPWGGPDILRGLPLPYAPEFDFTLTQVMIILFLIALAAYVAWRL